MRRDLGFGCAVLFALPFVGAGVGTLLIWGTIGGRRLLAEREALQARYPGEPWRWRPEWAGAIKDATRPGTYVIWIFAGLWNAVAITASVVALPRELAHGDRAGWFILLFPAVGLALLVAAIRATIRLRKFGVSTLTLDTLPGVTGHHIAGTVVAGPALDTRQAVELTLTSIRRVTTGSGRNRSTSETILWQDTRTSVPSRQGAAGVAILFRFALPADVAPCDDTRPADQTIWRLRAAAAVPGVDFDATFEVPVFRAPESGRTRTLEGDAIGDIRVSIGGQAGTTPFYQIQTVASSGRKTTLGGWIRDKREAEWLGSRIRGAVGAKKKDE